MGRGSKGGGEWLGLGRRYASPKAGPRLAFWALGGAWPWRKCRGLLSDPPTSPPPTPSSSFLSQFLVTPRTRHTAPGSSLPS